MTILARICRLWSGSGGSEGNLCCSDGSSRTETVPGRSDVRRWGRAGFQVLPALGLIVLPKCPVCWAAYAGTFSVLGLAGWEHPAWLFWFLPVLMLAAAGGMALRRGPGRAAGPFAAYVAGGLLVMAGKLWWNSTAWMGAGVILLAAASVWFAVGGLRRVRRVE